MPVGLEPLAAPAPARAPRRAAISERVSSRLPARPEPQDAVESQALQRRRAGSGPITELRLPGPDSLAPSRGEPATVLVPPSYSEATAPPEPPAYQTLASAALSLRAAATHKPATQRPEIARALPLLLAAKLALRDTPEGPREVELWLGGSAAHRALGLLPERAWVDDLDPLLWVEARGNVTTRALAALVVPAIEQRLVKEGLRAQVLVTYLGERERPDEDILLVQVLGDAVHIDLRVVPASCRRRLCDIAANGLLVDFFRSDKVGSVPGVDAHTALGELSRGIYRDVTGLRRDGMVRLWRAHQKGFVPAGDKACILADALKLAQTLLRHIHPSPWADDYQLAYERGVWANRLERVQGSRPLAPLLSNALLSLAPLGEAHPLVEPLTRHLADKLRERCRDEPEPSAQLAALLNGRLGPAGLAVWSWVLASPQAQPIDAWQHHEVDITTPAECAGGAVRVGLPDTSSFVVVPYDISTWLKLGAAAATASLAQLQRLAEDKDEAQALAQLLGHPKLALLLPEGRLACVESRMQIVARLLAALQFARAGGDGAAWQERLCLAIARIVPFHAADKTFELAEPLVASLRRPMRRLVGMSEPQSFAMLLRELLAAPTGAAIDGTWPVIAQHVQQLDAALRTERLQQALRATTAALARMAEIASALSVGDEPVPLAVLPQGQTGHGFVAALATLADITHPASRALGEEVWQLLLALLTARGELGAPVVAGLLKLCPASLAAYWQKATNEHLVQFNDAFACCEAHNVAAIGNVWLDAAQPRALAALLALDDAPAMLLATRPELAERIIALVAKIPEEDFEPWLMRRAEMCQHFVRGWMSDLESARRFLAVECISTLHPLAPVCAALLSTRPEPVWSEMLAQWLVDSTAAQLRAPQRDEALARGSLIRVIDLVTPNERGVLESIEDSQTLIEWVGLVASFDETIDASLAEVMAKRTVLAALIDELVSRESASVCAQMLSTLGFYAAPESSTEELALNLIGRVERMLLQSSAAVLGELIVDEPKSPALKRAMAHLCARAAAQWTLDQPTEVTALLALLGRQPDWQMLTLLPEANARCVGDAERQKAERNLVAHGAGWLRSAPTFALRLWHALTERALYGLKREFNADATRRVLALFLWRTQHSMLPGDDAAAHQLSRMLGDEALRDHFEFELQLRLEDPVRYATTRSALVPLYLLVGAAPHSAFERRESMSSLIEELLRVEALERNGALGIDLEARSHLGLVLSQTLWSPAEPHAMDNAFRLNWQGFIGYMLAAPVPQPWVRPAWASLVRTDPEAAVLLARVIERELDAAAPIKGTLTLHLEARFVDTVLLLEALLACDKNFKMVMLLEEQLMAVNRILVRLGVRARSVLGAAMAPLLSGPLPVGEHLDDHISVMRLSARSFSEKLDGAALRVLEERLAEARCRALATSLYTAGRSEAGLQLDTLFDGSHRLPPLDWHSQQLNGISARLAARWNLPLNLDHGCQELMAGITQYYANGPLDHGYCRRPEQGWPYLLEAALSVAPGAHGILEPFISEMCFAPPTQPNEQLFERIFDKLATQRRRARSLGLSVVPNTLAKSLIAARPGVELTARHRAWLERLAHHVAQL